MIVTRPASPLSSPTYAASPNATPADAKTIRHSGYRMMVLFMLMLCGTAFTAKAAIIPVTNGNDAGAGSLRQAIISAANFDVIEFSGVSTVTLTSGELSIGKPLTINGGAGVTLTRSGTIAFRLMTIGSGFSVTITNLKFTNGKAELGGAIYNNSSFLLLDKCIFWAIRQRSKAAPCIIMQLRPR